MPPLRDELARTRPLAGGSADAAAVTAVAAVDIVPSSDRASVAEQLRRLGYPFPQRARIEIHDQLGMGATARVFAAEDHDLGRPVAVKVLASEGPAPAEAVASFLEEARITASLQHPNVLPVHEVEVNGRGQVFFTMKRVDGRSLGAALLESTPARRLPPLDDANALVSVVIGVGQALAYAHRRRIVHQDVKPDNIMLGDFGEVLLVDWGSARRLDAAAGEVYGTPLYMSPEQARGEAADERSDVYCLGATLFHSLTLRLPTWADDGDAFWARKRRGELDPPGPEERAGAPAPLLAIALKALAAEPAQRYPDAAAMVDDLRRYQGGLAVSALRESPLQRLRRWHRRHARSFWAWTAAAALVLALAATLYGERIEQIAHWGAPRAEPLTTDAWSGRWVVADGTFRCVDGAVVSEAAGYNIATLREPILGAAAVEYVGLVEPGRSAADVSLLWSRELDPSRSAWEKADFAIQIGAWDGAFSGIALGSDRRRIMAQGAFRPTPGVPFRARVEFEDDRITLRVDGRTVCSWTNAFPVEGGYLSLFAVDAGKSFSDLRIQRREVPGLVSALAIGDEAARAGEYEFAARAYARIATSHAGRELGTQALYKQGLCLWRLERRDEALALWEPIRTGVHADDVRLHRLEAAFAAGRHDEVLAGFEELWRAARGERRALLALQWGRWTDQLDGGAGRAILERYAECHARLPIDEPIADHSAAVALQRLGRADEVIARFPSQRDVCAYALFDRQEYLRVVQEYPDQRWQRTHAGFFGGLWDAMDPEMGSRLIPDTLWSRGRAEELLGPGILVGTRLNALRTLGRHEQALAEIRATPDWQQQPLLVDQSARLLVDLGRYDEAAALSPSGRRAAAQCTGDPQELAWLGTQGGAWPARVALLRAIRDRAEGVSDPAPPPARGAAPGTDCMDAFELWLLGPLIAAIAGDPRDFDAACEELAGRWRYANRQRPALIALFVLGRIDAAAVLAGPCATYAAADLALARALASERRGDRVAALAAWKEWGAFPAWLVDERNDLAREAMVRWRVRELSAAPARPAP